MYRYGLILLLYLVNAVKAKELKLSDFENEAYKLHYSEQYLKSYGKQIFIF